MPTHYSPLRYPGGKAQLAPYIKSIIEANDLVEGDYVEPFCGGAAVAMELLSLEYVRNIYLNDIDAGVNLFWKTCLRQPERLCRMIRDRRVSISTWEKCRTISQNWRVHEPIESAFAFFFLNRTNRSGIIRGGVIGGRQQSGRWKIDARYNKRELIRRIENIAYLSPRIHVYRQEARAFVQNIVQRLPCRALIYLDPPYFTNSRRLYTNAYELRDHEKLARRLQALKGPQWLVSYDAVPQARALYKGLKCVSRKLRYSAATVTHGSEYLFFAPGLKAPPKPH